jgi:hypothetical protein
MLRRIDLLCGRIAKERGHTVSDAAAPLDN